MKLGRWLFQKGLRQIDFAKMADLPKATVANYVAGTRTPTHDNMRKIFLASNGQVQPNDFYRLDEWRDDLAGHSDRPLEAAE